MATAADVPGKYDVVINSQGYVFLDALEPGRSYRARFSLTPTFVERQNVSGDFGDNQQDFYMTFTQRDWSLGEGQRFFRTDAVRSSKYWLGQNVDILKGGQVSIKTDAQAVGLTENIVCIACRGPDQTNSEHSFAAGATTLWAISTNGGSTTHGVHGLGTTPSRFGLVCDEDNVYVSTTAAGTVGVRKLNASGAWSTFSASGSDSLAFLNNTLYGYREDGTNSDLVKYSTAGVLTSVFPWKNADGGAIARITRVQTRIRAGGSKLYILRTLGERASELWQYDGTSTTKIADFPPNFIAIDFDISGGLVFVCGRQLGPTATTSYQTVYSYDPSGATVTKRWQSPTATTSATDMGITAAGAGVIFNDDASGSRRFVYYDIALDAASTIVTAGSTGVATVLAASPYTVLAAMSGTSANVYTHPAGAARATSAVIFHSLADFDSSLSKRFKAVKVDFDLASDGNGGSVDIAYQLDSVDGSYTNLQTGAAAGTEYTIDQTGRSIAIKVTLNKGTSTAGPVLKRVYVRAVPIQPSFKLREYLLDLSGAKQKGTNVRLRGQAGRISPKDGAAMAADLLTAVTSQVPISITDRFGTFTGILEPDQFELLEIHSGEYVAHVVAREV